MAESLMVSQATQDTVNNKQNSSDNALNTTAKTVIGAINEHESDISTLNSNITNDVFIKTAKNRAFAGDLNNLNLIGYYFGNAANITNAPITSGYLYIACFGYIQMAFEYSSTGIKRKFVRGYENSQWYPWQCISAAKRAYTLSAGATITFTWDKPYSCAKIWFYGFDSTSNGLVIVRNNNGTLIKQDMGANLTSFLVTQSGNTVSIKSNYAYGICIEIESVCSLGDYGAITFS